ncbi:MAG: tagatose 1,6-diphosphate aldolase [Anaerolineae bacterium]
MNSSGKIRGLQATSNKQNIFTILAVDHGASLAGTIRPGAPESVSYADMVGVKRNVLSHLAPSASGVLIDPVYGLGPAVLNGAVPGNVGMLLAVEDGDYASVTKEARLFDGWSVAQAKRAGANGIKCFFYFHPDDKAVAEHQEKFVRQLSADCAEHDIPLFAEPLSYDVTPETRRAVVIETARQVSRWDIDILKIEFPIDSNVETDVAVWSEACEELSAASVTPWALLSAGVDFDTFAKQVEIACKAGASGYLVGRAVWKEGVVLEGDEQIQFWQNVAQPRLEQLAQIATKYAKPWTGFYQFEEDVRPMGWHKK